MSLVGPRPLYVEQIDEWNDEQKKRLLVKPGLTGLAQINGRGELTKEEKLAFDVEYVKKASPAMDLKIIFITFFHVFAGKSIYEKNYSRNEQTRGQKN
jgi:sugar transferase EpsL